MDDLRQQLERALEGSVCYMGIGNVDRGDDGFGVRLAEALITDGVPDVVVAFTVPENFVGVVAKKGFDHLVFLDAVDFGGAPGSAIFFGAAGIESCFPQISTHKIALGSLARLVEGGSATRVWLLAVQPESLADSGLTGTLEKSLEALRDLLLGVHTRARSALADVKR